MNSLINDKVLQKKFQEYMDLTCEIDKESRTQTLENVKEKIKNKIKAIQQQARSIPKAYYLEFGECMLQELLSQLEDDNSSTIQKDGVSNRSDDTKEKGLCKYENIEVEQ
jgi:predicted glycosyl hydrolase (DUF1957 family)